MLRNFLVFFLLLLPRASQGQSLEVRMDSLFDAENNASAPGVAVVIVRGDSIHFAKGYGIADLEHNIPITPNTVFMAASVSKQFTAYGMALLSKQDKISIQDTVTKYVPELQSLDSPITIEHLIHHTSGLKDEFSLLALAGYRMDDVITKEDILRLIFHQTDLNFESGTRYSYSNSGYTLLAEIIERISQQSFRSWMHQHVFQPLGMNDSHFRSSLGEVTPNIASGYITSDDGYKAQRVNYASVGASGLYTTALDLGRWLIALKNGEIGGIETRDLAQTRGVLSNGDTLNYAYGLSYGRFRGTPSIGHSGSHRGYRTWAGRFPDHDLGIVVLANLEELNPSLLAQKIASLFIEEKSLYPYEGTYYSTELNSTISITLESDTLRVHSRRGNLATLSRSGHNSFTSDIWYLSSLEFDRDANVVSGVHVSSGRSKNIWFQKLDP